MQSSQTLDRSVNERLRRGVGVSTAERVRQAGEDSLDIRTEFERTADGGTVVVVRQRVSQAPLDRLFARGAVTKRQFEAGDIFREDAYQGGMVPFGMATDEPVSRSVPGPRTPQFLAAHRLDAYRDWAEAQEILGRLYPIVDEVCWASGPGDTLMAIGARVLGMKPDKRAETAALAVLRVGLDTLADHYGM